MPIKRALVVDDSKAAGLALRRMLEQHSVSVDLADSGEAALTYLKSQMPDVIFMDHIMPGLNGLEATKAIIADPKTATIPIVMYTSTEGDSYLDKAKAHGARGILPKPPKPAALAQWIHQLGGTPERVASSPAPAAAPAPASAPSTPAGMSAASVETIARGAAESVVRTATQTLVTRMMEEQLPQLRQDILARCETIAKQVAAEFLHARVNELGNQLRTVQEQLTELAARPAESAGTAAVTADVETLARAIAEQAAVDTAAEVAQRIANAAARETAQHAAQMAEQVYEARVATLADRWRAELTDQIAELRTQPSEPVAISSDVLDELANSSRAAAIQAAADAATPVAEHVARNAAQELFDARSAALIAQLRSQIDAKLAEGGTHANATGITTLAPEVIEELKSVARHVASQRIAESAHKVVQDALQQSSQETAKVAARLAARQLDKAMEAATRSQMSRVYWLSAMAAGVGVLAAFIVHLLH